MWSTSASVTQMIEMSSKERVSSQPRKPYNPYSIYIQFQYMQYYAVPVNMNCSLTVSLFYLAHKNASTKCPFFFGLFKVVTYEMSFSISDCRTSKHSRSFSIFSFYFFFFLFFSVKSVLRRFFVFKLSVTNERDRLVFVSE